MDIVTLIPQFGGLIWTLLAFVVALSVIVAVHEYGHYIVGRWSGIDADVFSLGFGPVLFSRVDRRGTKWQFALLPFGGYVKFKGDDNASGGKDEAAMAGLSEAERRRTMNGAPLWARAATVAAGPVFNFILSILIFSGIFLARGVVSEPLTVGELRPLPSVQELEPGDVIAQIEGRAPPAFDDGVAFESFLSNLPEQPVLDYTVQRDGAEQVVEGPYVYPPLASQIIPLSAADDAGMRAGDVIQSIDGDPIFAFDQLKEKVEASEGAPLALEVWRDGVLIGGLYGLALGRAFFGESMFSRTTGSSKLAIHWIRQQLTHWRFDLFDCQVGSEHLSLLGATGMPREQFVTHVHLATSRGHRRGRWRFDIPVPSSTLHTGNR